MRNYPVLRNRFLMYELVLDLALDLYNSRVILFKFKIVILLCHIRQLNKMQPDLYKRVLPKGKSDTTLPLRPSMDIPDLHGF
jgi:hypothetical protein